MLFKKPVVTVVAHDGEFHADDVFAVATLCLMLKDTHSVKVVRSRDNDATQSADYVVDVGGVYDSAKNRFDHHQSGGAGKRENGIPFASFGLVWKTYGPTVAGSKEAADIIDQKLVSPVDALDNGTAISKEVFKDVRNYGVSALIAAMNPAWNEDRSRIDETFLKAVDLARMVLEREIAAASATLIAEAKVMEVYKKTEDKRLLVLDKNYDCRRMIQSLPEPLYILAPREADWRIRAVKKDSFSFENRKDLPASWAGKMGKELADITGVSDALFCHNKLFLASARSKEGALKLAQLALGN